LGYLNDLWFYQLPTQSSSCTIDGFNPFSQNISATADSIKLDAGIGFTRYRWSTNDTTQFIHAKYTGGYKVTVTNASGCTASDSVFVQFPDTVGLQIPTVAATCNQSVDVPIKATKFRHLLSLQASVNWNAADLRFDSIVSYGPTSLALNSTNIGTTQTQQGKLSFSWNDAGNTGITLADSTSILTLRFTVLSNTAKTVPVTISSSPVIAEAYDASFTKKSLNLTSGAVNISCEVTISGRVQTPTGNGVKHVLMTLSGSGTPKTVTTDSTGSYQFKVLPGSYVLTPSKTYEQQKTNGVTSFDLALIQAHILQKPLLNNGYKVIAGDANNSNGLTNADLMTLFVPYGASFAHTHTRALPGLYLTPLAWPFVCF
jgi:hypothetical protein